MKFHPSPARDLGNGTILNGFRLSEFDLCYVSSVPRSIPGYSPWGNVTAQDFKDTLRVKGQYLETFGAWCWINFLAFIKHQNLNSQQVNGVGIHTGSSLRTMTEDNIQGLDGYVGINANDNVRTLGIQNFYGHTWNFLHNIIVRSANKVWIKKDFINADIWPTYSNAIASGWEELAVTLTGSSKDNGWISKLALNSADPWALYPSKLGGNNVEPIGDMSWSSSNNPFSVVAVGGDAWRGAYAGALCWDSYRSLSTVFVHFGGRSLELIL